MTLEVNTKNMQSGFDLFGSFFIDESEFVIHVDCIQEVVNFPDRLIKVPLAPSFLLGVFNLRGVVIPIVDFRNILKFESLTSVATSKVAIIDHGGVKVGLLFDSTGEILRVRHEDKSDFQYSNDSKYKVIVGAIKLENGNRLLQIVDPLSIINIENIPHVLENQKKLSATLVKQHGQRKKCISFSSSGIQMAFEIGGIYEILKVPEIQSSALESKICIGMITVRGQVIPVINFSKVVGHLNSDPGTHGTSSIEDQRIIVLKVGQECFGLLVDSVNSINSYYEDDVMPIPLLAKERAQMFQGCLDFSNLNSGLGEVVLLNHLRILSDQEILEITHGHSKIYQQNQVSSEIKKRGSRHVYIVFSLDHLFGISINDVKEIIEYPKDIISTPGSQSFVRGVLNLRGQLVTIVDTRNLYRLNPVESLSPKVLIFQTGSEKFGLLVDSVESILMVTDDQKMKLPELLYSQAADTYKKDIKEAIEVTLDHGKKQSLIVLDIAPIADRIRLGA